MPKADVGHSGFDFAIPAQFVGELDWADFEEGSGFGYVDSAVQTVGAPSSGVAFRDYPDVGKFMAAIMGAVGYAGAYVPFNAKNAG